MKPTKFFLTSAFVLACVFLATAAGAQDPVLTLSREIVGLDENGYFIPGTTLLEVIVTLDVASGDPGTLTAVGLEETWAAGWTFNSAPAGGDCRPDVRPGVNAEGPFPFAYIAVPEFPCTFNYFVNVPANPVLPIVVSGQLKYRTDGDEILPDPTENEEVIQLEPTVVSFTRELSGPGVMGDFYVPGEEITVTLTVEKSGPKDLTALGFQDLAPAGWTFVSAGAENRPDVRPAAGATTPFDFAYIAVPDFPLTFSYTVAVPADADTEGCFAGTAEFRTDGGPEFSDSDLVCLNLLPCVSFERNVAATYTPGGQVTVEIVIDEQCSDTITAIGFTELAPAGWTFVSSSGANNPDVRPGAGGTSPFDFAWIAVPDFPASFTYVMDVPADAEGGQQISGQVQYRFLGGTLWSEIVVSELTDSVEAVCIPEIEVALDADGIATITVDDVDGGSSSGPNIVRVLSQSTFTCADLGDNTVTLTVTGPGEDNVASCDATVTVVDNINPFVVCQNFTVALGANGQATVTAANLVADSGDNCSGPSITLSRSTFSCEDVGANTVTVTATDGSGNTATCEATVTVVDTTAPALTCQNATVNLGAGGTASITQASVVASVTDNCGAPSVTLSRTSFTCADLGANTVTVTATDVNGNVSNCTATVIVRDVTNPTVTCQDATVNLGADGTASISQADVVASTGDNCGVASVTLSRTNFTCADAGANAVLVTVTDTSGNTATCTATVTVQDATDPVAACRNVSVELDTNGVATITADEVDGGSTDNCGIVTRTLSQDTFTCDDLGENSVVLTVADAAGNSATCEATVVVVDTTAPVIQLQGNASVVVECGADYVDAGATASDNCGDLTNAIDVSNPVDTSQPGVYTVTYNVSDASGNAAQTVTRTVEVRDTTPPVISLAGANPLTVDCGDEYVDPGATATDTCDSAVLVTVDSSAVIPDQEGGPFIVVVTATDASGNVSTATRTVFVEGDSCGPRCELNGFAITSPSARVVIPIVVGQTEAGVNITSSVDALNTGLCDFEVLYTLNGVDLGASVDAANGFPVSATVELNVSNLLEATVTDLGTGATLSDALTFIVIGAVDANNDGVPDNPFDAMPNDGDTWEAVVPSANCQKAVKAVTVIGSAVPGAPVVVTLANPDDPTQSVTVTVPRELVADGEHGVIIVAISCDAASLLFPEDSALLDDDLPSDLLVAGAAFVEISVIVSSDGGATFDEVDDAVVAANPVGVCLTGLAFTPGLVSTFFSHPTFVGSDDTFGVILTGQAGVWDGNAVQNADASGGVLCAEATALSAFAPFEEIDLPPTLQVTPNPAFTRIVGLVEVGKSVTVAFTVKNVGSGTVTGTATLTSNTGGAYQFAGSPNYTLASGATQTITVRFTPVDARDGGFPATIAFSSSGGGAASVNLLGTGTTAVKAFNIFGCGPAEGRPAGGLGDLAVVLLAAGALVALTRVRRARQQ